MHWANTGVLMDPLENKLLAYMQNQSGRMNKGTMSHLYKVPDQSDTFHVFEFVTGPKLNHMGMLELGNAVQGSPSYLVVQLLRYSVNSTSFSHGSERQLRLALSCLRINLCTLSIKVPVFHSFSSSLFI